MMLLGKTCAFVAFWGLLASAAQCPDAMDSCMENPTSLLQVQSAVQRGAQRRASSTQEHSKNLDEAAKPMSLLLQMKKMLGATQEKHKDEKDEQMTLLVDQVHRLQARMATEETKTELLEKQLEWQLQHHGDSLLSRFDESSIKSLSQGATAMQEKGQFYLTRSNKSAATTKRAQGPVSDLAPEDFQGAVESVTEGLPQIFANIISCATGADCSDVTAGTVLDTIVDILGEAAQAIPGAGPVIAFFFAYFAAILPEAETCEICDAIMKDNLRRLELEFNGIKEELSWLQGAMVDKTSAEVQLSYLIMVQHGMALMKSPVFHEDCMTPPGTTVDASCKEWNKKTEALELMFAYAMQHLSLLMQIAALHTGLGPTVYAHMATLAPNYGRWIQSSFDTWLEETRLEGNSHSGYGACGSSHSTVGYMSGYVYDYYPGSFAVPETDKSKHTKPEKSCFQTVGCGNARELTEWQWDPAGYYYHSTSGVAHGLDSWWCSEYVAVVADREKAKWAKRIGSIDTIGTTANAAAPTP